MGLAQPCWSQLLPRRVGAAAEERAGAKNVVAGSRDWPPGPDALRNFDFAFQAKPYSGLGKIDEVGDGLMAPQKASDSDPVGRRAWGEQTPPAIGLRGAGAVLESGSRLAFFRLEELLQNAHWRKDANVPPTRLKGKK